MAWLVAGPRAIDDNRLVVGQPTDSHPSKSAFARAGEFADHAGCAIHDRDMIFGRLARPPAERNPSLVRRKPRPSFYIIGRSGQVDGGTTGLRDREDVEIFEAFRRFQKQYAPVARDRFGKLDIVRPRELNREITAPVDAPQVEPAAEVGLQNERTAIGRKQAAIALPHNRQIVERDGLRTRLFGRGDCRRIGGRFHRRFDWPCRQHCRGHDRQEGGKKRFHRGSFWSWSGNHHYPHRPSFGCNSSASNHIMPFTCTHTRRQTARR